MKAVDLCGTWQVTCHGAPGGTLRFDGRVPGSAIADLVAAGHLPQDLFFEKNADALVPFEGCDYTYERRFSFSGDGEGATLRFERLDTYADVFLNGALVYHGENGNIRHDIPLRGALREGENLLCVKLYSPTKQVQDRPVREAAFTAERLHIRRMQCTFGWDWVARFVTCALGACTLMLPERDELPLEGVYIVTTDADAEAAAVRVDVTLSAPYRGRVLELCVLDPDGVAVCRVRRFCAEALLRFDLDIPSPALWYPLGYGAQPLYTLSLLDGERELHRERFGIRTVRILQIPDPVGGENHQKCLSIQNEKYDFNESFSGFVLKINGKRIFCRGANWVPCVPYAMGDISKKQTELLTLCAEAGVNMLRVWGGGAFEAPHFYDECARLGIMVTQDFLMACGHYPEEERQFIDALQAEALYAARLLRNQPCLVWWTGDNENAVKGCDTDEDYRGRRAAYEGIAPILYREDPYRRFLPSSPFGGNKYASNTVGTTHNTQFLKKLFTYLEQPELSDYKEAFKNFRARFIAEEAQMGAASLPSLRKFLTDADIFEGDALWRYHTKSNPGLKTELFDYLCMFAEKLLGRFTDGEDRLFKLRYIQFEWVRVLMEQARRERGFCDGILFWMMNDCWPAAAGWSLIDYYNLPKDAYYAFKRCARPVLATLDREGGKYRARIVNDGASEAQIQGRILVLDQASGACRVLQELFGSIPAGGCLERTVDLALGQELLLCEIEGAGYRDRAFYREGGLPLARAEVCAVVNKIEQTVTLTAGERYLHAVTLTGEAVFEDNCFSLLPGESRTLHYRTLKGATDTDITAEAYTPARL